MRKLYTFKEIVSKKKKKKSGSSSIAFTEWHVTKIVDFSRWHSTSTMEIWLRYLISTKIFHVPKWIGIDTWPNNIAKSSITSQWQSKFGFAYIPSYTYLYYGSSSIIHIHSFSLWFLSKNTKLQSETNGCQHIDELWHRHHSFPISPLFFKVQICHSYSSF